MELQHSAQLAQAAVSVLVGAGLGLLYDLLRLPRLLLPARLSSGLCDFLFCLTALPVLFVLGLGPGNGQLRLFMCLFVCGGFLLWRHAPGRFLQRGEAALAAVVKHSAQIARAKLRIALHKLKKYSFFKKISFQTRKDGLQ